MISSYFQQTYQLLEPINGSRNTYCWTYHNYKIFCINKYIFLFFLNINIVKIKKCNDWRNLELRCVLNYWTTSERPWSK